jgi:hypothetical protein
MIVMTLTDTSEIVRKKVEGVVFKLEEIENTNPD